MHSDGTVDVAEVGSLFSVDEAGEIAYIDTSSLRDTSGRSYGEWMIAHQDEPDGPISYSTVIARIEDGAVMSDEERVDALRALEPELTVDSFRARRAARLLEPVVPTISPLVEEALTCGACEHEVIVSLREHMELQLPRPTHGLREQAPDLFFELQAERLLELERHNTAIEVAQEAIRSELEALGGTDFRSGKINNHFYVTLPTTALEQLANDPRIEQIDLKVEPVGHWQTGTEIREGTQIQQLLDHGFDGESNGTRNPFSNNMLILFGDGGIDVGHPAWKDCATCPTRLRAIECFNGSSYSFTDFGCHRPNSVGDFEDHGTWVAGQAVADLTQDQDGNHSTQWEERRTGMSTESEFVFLQRLDVHPVADAPELDQFVSRALEFRPDVLNASFGHANLCTPYVEDDDANDAFKDGVFWVSAAGNSGYSPGQCNVGSPGTAPGSFTVGATDHHQPVRTAPMATYSSLGGDVHGRHLVDIVAPGGRTKGCLTCSGTLTKYNSAYGHHTLEGTSLAAPVVAGAAANYKDHLVSFFGSAAEHPGVLNAHMLLMADRYEGLPGAQDELLSLDSRSGAGRLRMRMFNEQGMDAPWGFGSFRGVIKDGKTITIMTNPRMVGGSYPYVVNDPIPAAADLLSTAAFWYEPNVATNQDPASIQLQLYQFDQVMHASDLGHPGAIRVVDLSPHLPPPNPPSIYIAGTRIKVRGLDVPISTEDFNGAYAQGDRSREVNVAYYWEDRARDDPDGPPASIQ